jgi:hypothetical protein
LLPLAVVAPPLLFGQTRLNFESRVAANGDGEIVLTNRSNVAITAYVFEIFREPCNPIEAERHVFAGYDKETMPDGKGVPPLASQARNIGASHCNKDGTHSPAKASLKVALFANGEKFGDERWAAILRQHRQFELRRIDGAIVAVTQAETVAQLRKAGASFSQIDAPQIEFYGAVDPYEMAINQLTEQRRAELLGTLEAWRSGLQQELRQPAK